METIPSEPGVQAPWLAVRVWVEATGPIMNQVFTVLAAEIFDLWQRRAIVLSPIVR